MAQFNSILVANRGEIALRIMRTAREMGIKCIAVYTEADAHSPHVEFADQAICIGEGPVGDSYLDAAKVLAAAKETGAQAVHPGYGFLSENADFAKACTEAGLTFIGPSAEAIALMGNKAAAKRRMIEAGVPCVPGYEGADQSPAVLQAKAAQIGYPVMIKAAAGGGNSQFDPATPRGYSPKNVGNDASARPWESHGGSSDATVAGSMIDSSLSGSQGWGVPAGFDAEGFLKASKANFLNLQDAWDRSDIPSLRAMMTDGMLEQIQSQLAERERSGGGTVNKTEVVMLEAHLLGIEEMDAGYMASVEFSGLIREDVSAGPNPFREVWNITRPKNGSGGWLVAGVQALQ